MAEAGGSAIDESVLPRRSGLLRRVLRTDVTQEYLVYLPTTRGSEPPLLASVHGVSRNAEEHGRLLSAYCEMHGVVLVVPVFSPAKYPDYQRLGRVNRGKRADLALDRIVEEVAALSGASAERFHLFGFSGGAQFAHRYALAHPHRLASGVFASAGWYTFPDPTRRFPHGTGATPQLPGLRFDAEEFLKVPMRVIVAEKEHDAKRLRRSERLDREQGSSRAERARNWVSAMRVAARAHFMEPRVGFEKLPDCRHSFRRAMLRGGLGEALFAAILDPSPSSSRSSEA
ncbi:MAG: hypothetical protein QNK04_02420 [Myxococcota bacterium]|nr:hypothetical protein [Myxococcota bacterium]